MRRQTINLDLIDGYEFEDVCGQIFSKLGYGLVENTPASGDVGKDLVITSPQGRVLVECKHQPNTSIGRPVIQKLHSAVISHGGVRGIVVTTGRFSNQAIQHAATLRPPIELVDRSRLNDFAARAGMEIISGTERGTVYSFPIVDDREFSNNLSRYLGSVLRSHPANIHNLLTLNQRRIDLKPVFSLTYNVDSRFSTTVGQIHHEKGGGLMMIAGDTGYPLDLNISRYYTNAPLDVLSVDGNKNISIHSFKQVQSHVKATAMEQICRVHTKNISYTGANNHIYTKTCVPPKRDIYIRDISQIYYPDNTVSYSLVGRRRDISVFDKGTSEFYVNRGVLSACEICGKRFDGTALLCNECGTVCHEPGLLRHHSFYCKNCNKTICRECGSYYSKFLVFKVPLCKECVERERGAGKNIRKFKSVK